MPDKGGLQLLPDTRKKIEVRTPGENKMLIWGFITMAIVASLYFGLNMYTDRLNQEILDVDGQIRALEDRRDKKAETELSSLSKQSQLISGILNNHVFFSRAFGKLELLISPKIQPESLQLTGKDSSIALNLKATSYADIAKQISSFLSDPGIKDVSVGKLSPENSGRFSTNMILKLNLGEFLKKK